MCLVCAARSISDGRQCRSAVSVVILAMDNVGQQGGLTADTSHKYGMSSFLSAACQFWLMLADSVGRVSAPAPHG